MHIINHSQLDIVQEAGYIHLVSLSHSRVGGHTHAPTHTNPSYIPSHQHLQCLQRVVGLLLLSSPQQPETCRQNK